MAADSAFDIAASANSDNQAGILGKRVRFMYRMAIFGTVAALVVALLMGGYFWWQTRLGPVMIWMIYFALISVVRVVVYLTYRKADDVESNPESWVLAAILTMLFSGIGWGSAAWLFFDLEVPGAAALVTCVVTSMAVSGFLLLSMFNRIMWAFTLPASLPLIFKLATSGHSAGIVTAILLTMILATMVVHAMKMQEGVRDFLRLSESNQQLAHTMSASRAELERLNEKLQKEVAQRTNFQKELQDAKIAAESAAMAKDEFLATMSHEIRTPLNGILPILDILRSTKLDENQKDYLNTAFQSSKHLLSIIDDILDYSKIEAGKLELETVGLNLRDLLESVNRLMASGATKKGLSLKTEIQPGVRLALRGDPVRLRQVLTNLVSNAIKFTDRGGVTISVKKKSESRDGVTLEFSVADTGVGMDEKSAAKLFQPFSQADASTTRNYGGTGLGLVICKRIVELMGGEIGVKSKPGHGSIFWFTAVLKKSVGDIQASARKVQGSRALLATNAEDRLKRFKIFLDSWGMQHTDAGNLKDVVGHIKKAASMGDSWRFDALIVDTTTLGEKSVELVRRMRTDPRFEEMIILLLTENGDIPKALQKAQDLNAVPANASEGSIHEALESLYAGGGRSIEDEDDPDRASAYIDSAASTSQAPLQGRVLLVEDNPVNLHVAQKLLGVVGIQFDVAKNGREALELLKERQFGAVLMDCMMPVMDGYTATREWRAHEQRNNLDRKPIVAMTANAMAGDRQKCLDAGMDDYMSKPLNRHLIDQMLRKWLPDASSLDKPVSKPPQEQPATPPSPAKPKAAAPDQDSEVLDAATLKDLMEIMGDDFKDLVVVYLEDSPKALAKLTDAAENDSISGFIEPSHSLKSTSANLGALRLAEMARSLEEDARVEKVDSPVARVNKIMAEYKLVAAALEKYRQ